MHRSRRSTGPGISIPSSPTALQHRLSRILKAAQKLASEEDGSTLGVGDLVVRVEHEHQVEVRAVDEG